jgi:hypothetical protein
MKNVCLDYLAQCHTLVSKKENKQIPQTKYNNKYGSGEAGKKKCAWTVWPGVKCQDKKKLQDIYDKYGSKEPGWSGVTI